MGMLVLFLDLVRWVILADVILSWVQRDESQFPRSLTRSLTRPLYAPIHAIIDPQKMGGIDFTPLILLLLISVVQRSLY